ncbi:hypothetical protein Tco_1206800 [Tanacetum coccineum]
MTSSGIDRDAKDALSKLLQMGTVAEYQNDFEMLINRVTGISESLLTSFYISGLKLTIQIELLRVRPKTLGEAFSLARIIEARFEAIAEKEKEHINKKKGDTILSLQHKLASPEIKRSLDADEDIRVDDRAEGGRRALCYVQDSGRRKKKKMEAEIQRRLWDPGIKIVFRQHLEDKVVSEGVGSEFASRLKGCYYPDNIRKGRITGNHNEYNNDDYDVYYYYQPLAQLENDGDDDDADYDYAPAALEGDGDDDDADYDYAPAA